jgi:hypothetical protein
MQQDQPCMQKCEGRKDQLPVYQAACLLANLSYEWTRNSLLGEGPDLQELWR